MSCVHHWVIDPPNGPTSVGVCKNCGEEREFPNAEPENTHWKQAKAFRIKNERTKV